MALLLTAEVNAALIAALTARTALTALSIENYTHVSNCPEKRRYRL